MISRRGDNPRVVVVFLLSSKGDGSTNSRYQLRSLIKRRRAEGWQFCLIGAGFDASPTAQGFGIDDDAVVSCRESAGLIPALIAAAEVVAAFDREITAPNRCQEETASPGLEAASSISPAATRRHWAVCPDARVNSGGCLAQQRGWAKRQRGAKLQPGGKTVISGGAPGMASRRWPRTAPSTVDASKPAV